MTVGGYAGLVVIFLIVLIAIKKRRRRGAPVPVAPPRRTFGVGAGAIGTVYDMLNEERRNAIEIIVEDKAAYRDPEDADGNLPELEHPEPRGNRR